MPEVEPSQLCRMRQKITGISPKVRKPHPSQTALALPPAVAKSDAHPLHIDGFYGEKRKVQQAPAPAAGEMTPADFFAGVNRIDYFDLEGSSVQSFGMREMVKGLILKGLTNDAIHACLPKVDLAQVDRVRAEIPAQIEKSHRMPSICHRQTSSPGLSASDDRSR